MVARRMVAAAGAAIGVVVFGSALGSGALWRDSVSLDGGALRSGELSLLNGDASNQVADYAFEELAGSNLRPGVSVQAPLTIRNGGSADLTYRLAETAAVGSAALPAGLGLAVTRVSAAGDCGTGLEAPVAVGSLLYDGPFVGASLPGSRFLAAAGSEVLCLRLTVSAAAGAGTQSASSRLIFTFAAVST